MTVSDSCRPLEIVVPSPGVAVLREVFVVLVAEVDDFIFLLRRVPDPDLKLELPDVGRDRPPVLHLHVNVNVYGERGGEGEV